MLSSLEKWGVLGLGQLYGIAVETATDPNVKVARFFNEAERRDYGRWLAQRLTALADCGYIAAHFFLNHPKVFTLAERGHEELQARGLDRMPGFRGSISGEFVEHEVCVAAVGLLLSEVFHLEVRTERERYLWPKGGGRRPAPVHAVSDLWVVDSRAKAIEVELHKKSEVRYRRLWQAYAHKLSYSQAVLYLTTWHHGVRRIMELARKFRAPFVYAADLSEFRASRGRVPFVGTREGDSIVLEPAAVPDAAAAPWRVSTPSLPARAGFAGSGGRLGVEPSAPPSQAALGMLIPPLARRDQSVPPPGTRGVPRPHPLNLLPRSPEGEAGGAAR